jgi:hypothetical protein
MQPKYKNSADFTLRLSGRESIFAVPSRPISTMIELINVPAITMGSTVYEPKDDRPELGQTHWLTYVLDDFETVDEAVRSPVFSPSKITSV